MENKIIMLFVGLTVGVLLSVGLIAPVVASGQEELNTTTYTNDGAETFRMLDLSEPQTIIMRNGGYTINGENVNVATATKHIYADTFKADGTTTNIVLNINLYESLQYVSYVTTIEIADGTATITKNYEGTTTTYTTTCEWVAVSDSAGDYCYNPNGAYTDGSFYATYPAGIQWNGTGFVAIVANGEITLAKGVTTTNGIMADISEDITATTSDEEHFSTVTVTYNDTEYSLGILAPKTVKIDTPTAEGKIIAIIPIMAFIALIAFAAFAVRGRMND